MARRKREDNSACEIYFVDGPRGGTNLRVVNPPPARLRLAFPEWCNYYRKGNTLDYEYDMETEWVTLNALGGGAGGGAGG